MSLIEKLLELCRRLAKSGWNELLQAHGLNIEHDDTDALKQALQDDLSDTIQRSLKGFEDFAREGRRGIEAGAPALSLLYHALASPNVLARPDGVPLTDFPSPADLELVENYVFAAAKRSLNDVLEQAKKSGRPEPESGGSTGLGPGGKLAVVVFAYEYRPASQTCHKIHADLVFARTGIARVGTREPLYDGRRRGFLPEADDDPYAIRVCPARYAAYLAVQTRGDPEAFRPLSFRGCQKPRDPNPEPDAGRDFWVPVHKLFAGSECLDKLDLDLRYTSGHINEKIRRVHTALGEEGIPDSPPYVITTDIAELSTEAAHGAGLLVPVPHPRLIEPASLADGTPVTFAVQPGMAVRYSSFASPQGTGGGLRAPEFVHARTQVLRVGSSYREVDLNNDAANPDVHARVNAGGYDARHYVDWTGDGWIRVTCPELANDRGIEQKFRDAYSLVTAPDFFPTCDQRELTEWATSNAVPPILRGRLWTVSPAPLSDQRLAANLQMPGGRFDSAEEGMTALVPLLWPVSRQRTVPPPADALRHSHLPDDAAGVFDPGRDVTFDIYKEKKKPDIPHMAAYGLGSPFPEDAKLCAALGSYWPAVAPDSARTTEPSPNPRLSWTAIPLTDQEIGQVGNLPWDSVPGPRVLNLDGQEVADYASFQHVDYVRNTLAGLFTLRLTARIDPPEYQSRVLAMAFVYHLLGGSPLDWIVLSFQVVPHGTAELEEAQRDAQTVLHGDVYRFEVFERVAATVSTQDFRRRRVPVAGKQLFFVDPVNRTVLIRRADQSRWRRAVLHLG